jgi:hypothetical protein
MLHFCCYNQFIILDIVKVQYYCIKIFPNQEIRLVRKKSMITKWKSFDMHYNHYQKNNNALCYILIY